ncbi:MAG: DUF542 domain-containing protein [Gemmatimonas sp.]
MSFAQTSVTTEWTVGDVTRCFPMSLLVFHKLGVDTCCGATATLDKAAAKAGITAADIMAALAPCTESDDEPPNTFDAVHAASE